jgi:plasmid maintenance system antidote protein VapI
MLSDNKFFKMDPEKAEFKRLIELMGWSQTEAARRLRKTPAAINHLVNPDHPNKPTQTMMQLFKLIIASERPDLINPQTFELKETYARAKREVPGLSARERALVEKVKELPPEDREKVYAIIIALLKSMGGKGWRPRRS